MEPYYSSNSMHVFEDRYQVGDKKYVVYEYGPNSYDVEEIVEDKKEIPPIKNKINPHRFQITWFNNETNELQGEISIDATADEVRELFGLEPDEYPGDGLQAFTHHMQWIYNKIAEQGVDIVIDQHKHSIYVEIVAI